MRTISSFTLVGTLLPPKKAGWPLLKPLFAGKMPAFSSAVEFGSIMQLGIVALGKAAPDTSPAGAFPPQFLKRKLGLTTAFGPWKTGTVGAGPPDTSPPYQAVSGTVWSKV